jgi:hypothetical protein
VIGGAVVEVEREPEPEGLQHVANGLSFSGNILRAGMIFFKDCVICKLLEILIQQPCKLEGFLRLCGGSD